jgi:hypothetical protein
VQKQSGKAAERHVKGVQKKSGKEGKGVQKKSGKKGKGMEKQTGKGVKRKRDCKGVKMAVKLEFSGEVEQGHVEWTLT